MGTPRIRSLSARIQHIAAFEQLPAAQRNADLRALVLEALALLRETVDVARLDHSFSAERATDFNALSTAVDLLATATQGQVVELAFGTVDTGEIAADLRSFVGSLQDNATQLDPVELGLRIELGLRSMYSRLLGAAVHLGASLDDLRSLVRTKVSLLTQEQVNQVWGQIRAEFRPVEHDNNFSIQHGVVDDAFFAAQPEQYRDRIAEYVVEHRPRLELVHAQRNLGSMPMNVVSLARVLTWTQTADATPLDQRQRGILVSISRLATYWRDLFGPETVELARALDIGEDGVLSESSVQETRRQLDLDNRAADLGPDVVVYELLRLVEYASEEVSIVSEVVRALRGYKLGLEVMMPDSAKYFWHPRKTEPQAELWLQRHASKFLVERGIVAYGTRFGTTEPDLYVREEDADIVVEAKRYTKARPPTVARLRQNLVQLQSYLDQNLRLQTRGVLLVYNFSNRVITAEEAWYGGCVRIVSINLVDARPSRRQSGILVQYSDTELAVITQT